jgi:thiamine-monophosphate kinase
LLLKSDPVVEGIHFTARARAEDVGWKAMGRVLSDVAAMGGEPLWVLVDLVCPASVPVPRLEGLYRGLSRLARRHGVALVGGDTSRGRTLELHVFAVGRVPRGQAILRTGARPGDGVYVTGALGGSGAGRHLRFEPRISEGQWLATGGWATAMMDISDGLATDLRRMMAASGTGAVIDAGGIPISPAARRMPGAASPLNHALADGEDFELLFTVPSRKGSRFETAWRKRFSLPCTRIGEMTTRRGRLQIQEGAILSDLSLRGYDHFAKRFPSPNADHRLLDSHS